MFHFNALVFASVVYICEIFSLFTMLRKLFEKSSVTRIESLSLCHTVVADIL